MVRKVYYIQGMHCSACEASIQKKVGELKGLSRVDVSLYQSRIVLEAESAQSIPSLHKLNQMFNNFGYFFYAQPQNKERVNPIKDILITLGFFVVFIALFYLLDRSKILSSFTVDANSNLPAFFLFGIAAGFSSCAALVGSLLLSVQGSWVSKQSLQNHKGFIPFLLFNGSRVVTFAILGGLLGVLGGAFKFSLGPTSVLTIVVSSFLFIIGMQMLGVGLFKRISFNFTGRLVNQVTNKSHLNNKLGPILLGAVTFFIPCGFTLVAQSQALVSGNFLMGASILTAFSLGTLPVLLLIRYSTVKFHKNPRFSAHFRLLSGFLIVFFAVFTINSQINLLRTPNISFAKEPAPTIQTTTMEAENPSTEKQVQLMQMEAKGFSYFPEVITIKANTPTRFEITNNGSVGCARAVYARGLYDKVIVLNSGLNTVEFMSPAAGTYQISCSMWMVEPITVIVE